MYVYFNPNPERKIVEDCAVRAIAKITNRSWEDAYLDLMAEGYELYDMPTSSSVFNSYLKKIGYERYMIPNTCPDCYTIADFCKDNQIGQFVVATNSHVIAVIDGNIYDSWDSSSEVPMFFWKKVNRNGRSFK